MRVIKNFLLSRTDSIGDVILTLPMAGLLKQYFPEAKVYFLGKSYTRPVIESSVFIDRFIDVEDFLNNKTDIDFQCIIHVFPRRVIALKAKELHIPLRVGTTNRIYHWWTCNKLIPLSRKNSPLHEAQLNTILLKPFIKDVPVALSSVAENYGLHKTAALPSGIGPLLDPQKRTIILHPKSQGSAKEWPLAYYQELIRLLDKRKYQIIIGGTEKELPLIQPLLKGQENEIINLCGRLTLQEYMSVIGHVDILLACSTGPLHIAAALGIYALGIYIPHKPVHPGRWQPIGMHAHYFVSSDCHCKSIEHCDCIQKILPTEILAYIQQIESAEGWFR